MDCRFPSMYQIHLEPSPWITEFDESLEDGHYILTRVSMRIDQKSCLNLNEGGLNLTVKRSPKDKALELISISIGKIIPWLMFGALPVIALSGFYFWWMAEWHEDRQIFAVIISIGTIVVLLSFLIGIFTKALAPRPHIDYFGQISYECHGTLALNAKLSKTYYKTPIVLSAGILGEAGALYIMLRPKKEHPKPAVG